MHRRVNGWIDTMSTRVKKHLPMLRVLATAPPDVARALIRGSPNPLLTCLCECAKNTLAGHVPLTQRQKARLQPYKKQLRLLANKGVSLKRKRVVVQRGGFLLSALAAPLIGLVSSLLTGKRP